MSTFARPERSARYVAYATEPFNLSEDGQTVQARSEVYVREFVAARIGKLKEREKPDERSGGAWKTLSVTIDAESVGLENDFSGSALADSHVADMLRAAYSNGDSVWIAFETVRKFKNSDGPIPREARIHALRGAKQDGSGGAADATRENCKNLIVGVGRADHPAEAIWSPDLTSDADEWPELRNNRSGNLPPSGWRQVKNGTEALGAITSVPSQSGGAGDVDAIVEKLLPRLVDELGTATQARAQPQRPAARPGRVAATEGREWEPYNSDGRVNAGSYLMSKQRGLRNAAFTIVTEAWVQHGLDTLTYSTADEARTALPADDARTQARELAGGLLEVADAVQERVVGRTSRFAKSHFEATRWAQHVIGEGLPYRWSLNADASEYRAWKNEVWSVAAEEMLWAYAEVSAWLDGPASDTEPDRDAADASTAGTVDASAAVEVEQSENREKPAAEDEQVMADYATLMRHLKSVGHEDRYQPLLAEQLGHGGMLDQIPASAMSAALAEWLATPESRQAFFDAARTAYTSVAWPSSASPAA